MTYNVSSGMLNTTIPIPCWLTFSPRLKFIQLLALWCWTGDYVWRFDFKLLPCVTLDCANFYTNFVFCGFVFSTFCGWWHSSLRVPLLQSVKFYGLNLIESIYFRFWMILV